MSKLDEELASLATAGVEKHVSVAALAAHLGVSPDFIRSEMDRQKLPWLLLGRRRVVPVSAIPTYVAQRAIGKHPARVEAAPPTPLFARRPRTLAQ